MKYLPFHDALEDCSRLAGKVPQASCLHEGDFPVIGQGKQAVEGFTNTSGLVFRGDLPVILFGDHTAAFKFIDRPFARGADGTKLFRPRAEHLDAKFAWHFLQTVQLPQSGYDRKAKYLENVMIPLPPLEEQRRIAAILDKANNVLSLCRKSLTTIESLTNSVFLAMFGSPFSMVSGRSHLPFRDMTERITYGFTSPMAHMDSGIPILTAKNIQDGFIDLENVHYARQDEFDALTSKCKPAPGDILITKDGSIGRCAIAPPEGPLCINQSVALVIPDRSRVVPEYVSAYVRCAPVQQRIQQMGKGNALKHLQITELAEFPSVIPPLADQMRFAELMAAIDRKSEKSKVGIIEAEKLARSLCFGIFDRTFGDHCERGEEPVYQDSRAN